jgi:CRP-like cAMP-binding protein
VIQIVEKCLSKSIEDRYTHARELVGVLSSAYARLRDRGERIDMKEKWSTLRYLKFFKDFSDHQITEVVDACEWRDYKQGETILVEGETETSFYIITSGSVEVQKENKVIGLLEKGDCFGEIAFIMRQPRKASIVARSDVSLMAVSAVLLEKAPVETQLRYYRVFLENLIARLSTTTAQLSKQGQADLEY